MKDPTTPTSSDRKKIMFYDSSDRQTRLRIRCEFDGITQSQFFRMMISGYIEQDELISSFLDACKEKYKIQGKQKRKKISEIKKNTEKTKKSFALEADELENIFDIIETETNL
jgi:hypothetical protein